MDKRLILAVAGSGKTYYIVQQLDEKKRFLVITYTNSGEENLRYELIKKFGYVPNNVKIKSYFTFLYSYCYKPFLADEMNEKGISYNYPKSFYDKSFLTKSGYLYYNRISKLLIDKNVVKNLNTRMEKYYDFILVDEVQDFGGNDFNFLMEIAKSEIEMLFVGDFYQHTFDTSRDGNINNNLHKNIDTFIKKFTMAGFQYDPQSLVQSRRCTKSTCDFIRNQLGINIESNRDVVSECRLVTDNLEVEEIFNDNQIVKLFFNKHYNYECRSDNWGACKGLGFENVCIIVNKDIIKLFSVDQKFYFTANSTKNKFYVACSRSKNNLYFVSDKMAMKYKKSS